MRRYLCLFLVFIMAVTILLYGCGREGLDKVTITPLAHQKQDLEILWREPDVVPCVQSYDVEEDLSNIENISDFKQLDILDKYMIYKNMFVIKKPDTIYEQFFNLYDENSSEGISSFITSDSMLHTYYLMKDYILRNVEDERLINEVKEFTQGALTRSMAIYNGIWEPNAKNAAMKNIAYFGIAMRLLGMDLPGGIPLEANRIIDNDVKRVKIRWSSGTSELFPYNIDYTKYTAEGHYLRSTEYNNYFLTIMWYGNTPLMFDIYDSKTGNYSRLDEQIAMSVIMTSTILGDKELKKLWEDIYYISTAFSGKSEDTNLIDMSDITGIVYGKNIDLNKIWDNDKIQKFYELSKQHYNIHCNDTISGRIKLLDPNTKLQTQFRIMGQMYNVDADIYANLVQYNEETANQQEKLPGSIYVPMAFGSNEAANIIKEQSNEDMEGLQIPSRITNLKGVLSGVSGDNPMDYSLNNSTFWVLKASVKPYATGYPSFMKSEMWTNKRLITFSAAVSDNNHSSYLTTKQEQQKGSEHANGISAAMPGYVEPDVDIYSRLEYQAEYTKAFLIKNNIIDTGVYNALNSYISLASFLKDMSVKELGNSHFSDEESERIKSFGSELRLITLNMVDSSGDIKSWESIDDVDKSMACMSDAYMYGNKVFQTAVGFPDLIYVIVPYEGKLYVTRGGIYSYYEFVKPASEKLGDREWQDQLKEGKEADQQMWIKKVRY